MIRPVLLALLCAIALPTVAQAQAVSALKGHDNNAPIDFEADRIEVQDRTDRVVLSGNVHVRQQEMTLDSARMTVAYADNGNTTDVQRLDASGGVTLKSPSETARGAFAIYDVNRRLITMIGGVVLTREGSEVRGGRLVINLVTGRATVDGSAVGGGVTSAAGGRVSGRFTVPARTTPAPAPASPPQ
jgi:lipopolysaccharide export system protein LptA